MNTATDKDIELLECYLDNALKGEHLAELRGRLAAEPALQSLLNDLRKERELRRPWMESLSPDPTAVDRVMAGIKKSIRRENQRAHSPGTLRYLTAAAACIVLGLTIGILVRGQPNPTGKTFVQTPLQPAATAFQVSLVDDNGKVVATQNFDDLQKAREFSDDLSRWQQRQKQIRATPVVPGADRF